jgi:hypothetical protein
MDLSQIVRVSPRHEATLLLDAPSFATEPYKFASIGVAKLAQHNIAGQQY